MPAESQPPLARLGTAFSIGGVAALLARELELHTLFSYWGDRTPLVVGTAVVLAALSLWRLRRLVAALAVALGFVWLGVAFTPVTRFMAQGLARHDAEVASDAVFVLASGLQKDGELTPPAMSRLLHGLELLGEGLAPRLVLSELPLNTPAAYKPYAPVARTLMAHLGLPQEVLAVGPVRNTHEEALAVAELFRAHGWTRVLLVTSPTHSRRAALAFEAVGLVVSASPATETYFDLETLASPDDRLKAFGPLIHERIGLAAYRWRGWIRE